MSDYPTHYGTMTVGALKKFLDNFPDDMYVNSHFGPAWTDTIRVKVSTVGDSESSDDSECEHVLSIAGAGDGQQIWSDEDDD